MLRELVELDASTRSRLEHLNAARTDEPPTRTALVGERFPVIGHVDEREGPRRLAFGLVEETREHRRIERIEQVEAGIEGERDVKHAASDNVELGRRCCPR